MSAVVEEDGVEVTREVGSQVVGGGVQGALEGFDLLPGKKTQRQEAGQSQPERHFKNFPEPMFCSQRQFRHWMLT